ncbi:nitrite reductase (cytochrome; ammonia-forming) c552 subunit [Pasteurellaceae bacterium Pebbles2]|nr:nitrite reductase (cytochrome; ammonia-forming) c552 subunit [Pasteurellaceae bacterium Pebbles2]
MNVLKKTLSSLVLAGLSLVMTQSVFAEAQVASNSDVAAETAETKAEAKTMAKYAPKKGELAPVNSELKIQSVNESFAEKYPRQYESWKATEKSTEIAAAVELDPRMIVMWGGYAFAKEYNKPRGHFYAITDVRNILRTGAPVDANTGPQPMACWTCKGPDVPRLIAEWGEEGYFSGKWAKGGAEIVNSIGCADCHDTTSKDFEQGKPALRIARPHVLRALDAIDKPFAEGDRTDQRAAVCANCHVEYYFDKSNVNNVVFPWFNGVDVDNIEKYYDEIEFKDWEHSISKAPMLKAQHPDFETWLQGTHGKNGVTCIDCHMPKVQGADGKVYTNHQIGNPFDAFESTCAKCHDQSKETLQKTVADHKKDIKDVMLKLEDQLVKAHFEAKAAWDAGATKEEMHNALQAIRHAQWRWDYSAAGHGGHMHAPDILLKVIASGLDRVADARTQLAVILSKHGVQQPIQYPDVSTAEKAWKVMGIDIEKERKDKETFLKTIVPQWDKEAKAKGLLLNDMPPAK